VVVPIEGVVQSMNAVRQAPGSGLHLQDRRRARAGARDVRGDKVTLGRGTVTVSFENRGRSRHGEIEDVYRFTGGKYTLVHRR